MRGDEDGIILKPSDTVEKWGNVDKDVLIFCAEDGKSND